MILGIKQQLEEDVVRVMIQLVHYLLEVNKMIHHMVFGIMSLITLHFQPLVMQTISVI